MMRAGAIVVALGAAFLMTFLIIGSSIDENGILHEPFALLPIGYLLLFLGTLLTLLGLLISFINKRHSGPNSDAG